MRPRSLRTTAAALHAPSIKYPESHSAIAGAVGAAGVAGAGAALGTTVAAAVGVAGVAGAGAALGTNKLHH